MMSFRVGDTVRLVSERGRRVGSPPVGTVSRVVEVVPEDELPPLILTDCGHEGFPERFELVRASTFRAVGRLIKAERARQDAKFGPMGNLPNLTLEQRMCVLTEEVGELAQALNDARCPGGHSSAGLVNARAELIQVAAVAVAWLEALEAGKASP